MMTQATLDDAQVQSVLRRGVSALTRVAEYVLPTVLDRRLQDLGERKEYLGAAEHEELLALIAFAHDRTIEKLQAEAARRDLQRLLPDDRQP